MIRPMGSVTGLAAVWNVRIGWARRDRRGKNELRRTIHHIAYQNVWDLKRRGLSNREGGNNRRWRKFKATQPRVIISTPFYDITE